MTPPGPPPPAPGPPPPHSPPDGKFMRTKKKKDVKCYKYEDGTKDDGAVLKDGVIDITVTKKS